MAEPWIFKPQEIRDLKAAARQMGVAIPSLTDFDSAQALELSHLCVEGHASVYSEALAARLLRLAGKLHDFATGAPSSPVVYQEQSVMMLDGDGVAVSGRALTEG